MAEDMVNPVTGTKMGVSGPAKPAIKGERAGESFASTEDMAKQAAMAEFLKLHPEWSGLGGASKRPPDFQQQFDAFYASKKKNLPGTPGAAPPAQNLPNPTTPPPVQRPAAPPPAGGIGNASKRGALTPGDLASPLTGENQSTLTAEDLGQSPLSNVDTETLMRILRG